jgi:hypothetical protein
MPYFTRKQAATVLIALTAVGTSAGVTACTSSLNGNQQEAKQQLQDTQSLENNQPLPHFNYSQERQNMIDIENAQARNVQTTTFWMNMGDPDPIGSCPSIGYGIPDSASLSNPDQVANPSDRSSTAIGQMDPTGIYAPLSSMGTFIICLTASGQPYIDRIESTVDTYGGPATWNYTKHIGQLVGAPTAAAALLPPSKAGK